KRNVRRNPFQNLAQPLFLVCLRWTIVHFHEADVAKLRLEAICTAVETRSQHDYLCGAVLNGIQQCCIERFRPVRQHCDKKLPTELLHGSVEIKVQRVQRQVGEHSAFAWTEKPDSKIVGIAKLRVWVFCADSPCCGYVNGSLRGKSRLYRFERRPCQEKKDDDASGLFEWHVVRQAAWHSLPTEFISA